MELYRKELKLAVIKGLDESRGSSNVPIKLTHDTSDEYINYTEQIHIRYLFDNQLKEEILPTNDNGFYIPGKPLSHDGPIELAVHLINGDIELVTNELSFVVKNAPNGTTQVDPSEFTWQQLVDQYVNAKLDTFANKLDLSKFEETVNGSIENQNQNIESFKTEVNANLSNQDKKITDLQNTTKVSLDSQNTKIDNFKSEVNTSLSNQNTSINQTTSAQNSKITTLESRMDTFTRLSEGSTTGDAELKDIRVGANGVTYNNAGDAVRGQYSQLKEDLDDLDNNNRGVNILNNCTWTDGYYMYITGIVSPNSDFAYSNKMRCVPNTDYNIKVTSSNAFVNFYDIDKKHISGIVVSSTDGNFTTPANAYYLVYSCLITNKSTDSIINSNPFSYLNNIKEVLKGFNDNILSKAKWKRGYYLYFETGRESVQSGWSYTVNYFVCGSGKTYAVPPFSENIHVCFYDANKTFISGSNDTVFTTPNNCAYLRLSTISDHEAYMYLIDSDNIDNISISDGDDIKKGISRATKLHVPLIVNSGTYDISNIGGIGLSVTCDIIGVGNPVIKANLPSFNDDFSILNFDLTASKKCKVDGLHLIANNCRYAIHCEMGGNKALSINNAYYRHEITNCIIETLDDRRGIGCGLGDNGLLIIKDCCLNVGGDYAIAVHTGYDGQRTNTYVEVSGCYMNKTVQGESIAIGDDSYKDYISVNNCSCESEPVLVTSNIDNIEMRKWNNTIRS